MHKMDEKFEQFKELLEDYYETCNGVGCSECKFGKGVLHNDECEYSTCDLIDIIFG